MVAPELIAQQIKKTSSPIQQHMRSELRKDNQIQKHAAISTLFSAVT